MLHDMAKRVWYEFGAVLCIGIAFLFFLAQALASGDKSLRDDQRLNDVTIIKRALEQYYNIHEYYPSAPDGLQGCTSSDDKDSWFFSATAPMRKEKIESKLPENPRKFPYRYCITAYDKKKKTLSYYIETTFEIPKEEGIGFDEDEERKFDYRIVREDGNTIYRVCGGEELQCKTR